MYLHDRDTARARETGRPRPGGPAVTPQGDSSSDPRVRRLMDAGCTIATSDTGVGECRVTLPHGFVVLRTGPSREQAEEAALSAAELILQFLGPNE